MTGCVGQPCSRDEQMLVDRNTRRSCLPRDTTGGSARRNPQLDAILRHLEGLTEREDQESSDDGESDEQQRGEPPEAR